MLSRGGILQFQEMRCNLAHMQGNVLRWHEEHGTTQMPATEYIAMLEKELTALRKQVPAAVYNYSASCRGSFGNAPCCIKPRSAGGLALKLGC